MNWRRGVVGVVTVCVGLLSVVGYVNATDVVWGQATPAVFAPGVQNTSPTEYLYSVSCDSAGNCTAVGKFKNAAGGNEAFTMTSTDGVWGQATPAVFAPGVQNTSPDAYLYSVSCVSAGNCTASGRFKNAAGLSEAFTMTSTGGVWGEATAAVFAPGVQNTSPYAYSHSVSCVSAGNCTAAGQFKNAAGGIEAFTMTSTGGVWGEATAAVFAPGVQNTSPNTFANSVSCVSAGNCTAAGQFKNAAGDTEAFTMTSTGGVWGEATAAEFAPGVQNTSPDAYLYSVSCVSAGNCTAVGQFKNAAGGIEAFTMTSTGGVWGEATAAVFAPGVQNTSPYAYLYSVSCVSTGNCTASGRFKNAAGGSEAFTMTSTGGVWGQATPAVFAPGVQNTSPNAFANSVSCVSAGNCTAAGKFTNAAGGSEAFTMTSTDGVWGQATPAVFAPGVQNTSPNTNLNSVSCVSAGNCTAVGQFKNAAGGSEAFTMTSPAAVAITYDAQGGSAVSDGDASTTVGGVIGALPTDPTRDGYTFVGWFTATSGGTQVTTSGEHGQTDDFTLYAQWIANPVDSTTSTTSTTTTAPEPATGTPVEFVQSAVGEPGEEVPFTAPSGEVYDVPPGEGRYVFPDGRAEPTPITMLNSELGGLEAGLPVFQMGLEGNEPGAAVEDPVLQRLIFKTGKQGLATGEGFLPGSTVEVWLFSEHIFLGYAIVGADGTFEKEFTVPESVAVGDHTVQAEGTARSGTDQAVSAGVVIADDLGPSGVLPATGSGSSNTSVAFAAVLAGLGMMLVMLRVRR